MCIIVLREVSYMKYIIKRNINLFGKTNVIKFGYNVNDILWEGKRKKEKFYCSKLLRKNGRRYDRARR